MTNKLPPVLVALDGSPRNAAVLRAADFYSKTTGAPLVILRVIPGYVPLPPEALIFDPTELERVQKEDALVELRKLGETLVPSVKWQAVVRVGVAWETICEEANRLGAQTTIIGSHGYDSIDRILGTTAQKVVNHAQNNVLVVRNDPPWRKVVCATDGSPCTETVFRAALSIAELFDAELHLVRAVTLPSVPASALQPGVHLDQLLLNDAKRKLSGFEKEAREEVRVHTHVELQTPRELVASHAKDAAALVVIGAHGYSLGERLLGTTAAWFVNHLACSVLIVRSGAK